MFDKLRYRIMNRSIDQFAAHKANCKLPDLDRLTSMIVIIEDLEKEEIRIIEDRIKSLFGISKTRFIIISEKASNDMLLSDQYCEVTTQDFGFMKVLKPEKQEEVRKLPMTHLLVNLAKTHTSIADYLATLPHANFRVSFAKSEHHQLYDLMIDSGNNSNPVNDMQALHDYLKALNGN